jgi:hypothetical protein
VSAFCVSLLSLLSLRANLYYFASLSEQSRADTNRSLSLSLCVCVFSSPSRNGRVHHRVRRHPRQGELNSLFFPLLCERYFCMLWLIKIIIVYIGNERFSGGVRHQHVVVGVSRSGTGDRPMRLRDDVLREQPVYRGSGGRRRAVRDGVCANSENTERGGGVPGHPAGRGKGLPHVVFEISRAERRIVYFGEERRDFGRAADRFVIVGYGMRRRSVPVLDARIQRHVASHGRSIAQHHGERHARRGPNGVFHPTPHLRRHHLNRFDAVLGSRAPGSRRKLGRLRAVPSAHGARDAPSKRRTTVLSRLVAHRRFRRRNHHHLLARFRFARARRDDVEPSFQSSVKIKRTSRSVCMYVIDALARSGACKRKGTKTNENPKLAPSLFFSFVFIPQSPA